jgi:nitrite reductase/ring-hydroxylating ferredoxin subunit
MPDSTWHDLGPIEELRRTPLREVRAGGKVIALSFADDAFGAVSGACNHVGGPLGDGHLEGDYVVCPWHAWKFHRLTGEGEPGFEADQVPRYTVEQRDGHLWIDLASGTRRRRAPHAPHPLERELLREPGPVRVLGISTTAMEAEHPRAAEAPAATERAGRKACRGDGMAAVEEPAP